MNRKALTMIDEKYCTQMITRLEKMLNGQIKTHMMKDQIFGKIEFYAKRHIELTGQLPKA